MYQETGLVSECEKMVRKKRQQDASLGLMDLTRVKDDYAEILDDRCYFPVVNVDMTLADKYADALPMLKQAYRVVDKESFLDWGLSSDYQMDQGGDGGEGGDGANFVEAGGHKLRKAKASASKDDVPVRDAQFPRNSRAIIVQFGAIRRNSLTARPSPLRSSNSRTSTRT